MALATYRCAAVHLDALLLVSYGNISPHLCRSLAPTNPSPLPSCTTLQDALVIGARFDVDAHGEACRLAFYGRLVQLLEPQDLHQLKVYKVGSKWGSPPWEWGGVVRPLLLRPLRQGCEMRGHDSRTELQCVGA